MRSEVRSRSTSANTQRPAEPREFAEDQAVAALEDAHQLVGPPVERALPAAPSPGWVRAEGAPCVSRSSAAPRGGEESSSRGTAVDRAASRCSNVDRHGAPASSTR